MSTATITPFDEAPVVELSQTLFRKQILPFGTIDYKGRKIKYDRKAFQDLIDSFHAGVMPQVPIQMADAKNTHTFDPERYRGEIKGMEITERGLEAIVEATPDGAEVIRKNPKLGVSVRYLENETRGGKVIPKLLQHVLLTLDPRIPNTSPWEEVALANEDVTETIDLSGGEIMGDEVVDPEVTPDPETDEGAEDSAEGSVTEGVVDDYTPTPEEEALAAEVLAELENEEGEEADVVAAANLAQEERITALEQELARERWANEAAALIDAGVPPAMVNLAEPVLSLPAAAVVELSNDTSVDASDVIRNMLAQSKGFVELSRERGNSFETTEGEGSAEDAILKNWKQFK